MNVGGVEIEVVRDNLTLRTTITDGANTCLLYTSPSPRD